MGRGHLNLGQPPLHCDHGHHLGRVEEGSVLLTMCMKRWVGEGLGIPPSQAGHTLVSVG